MPARIASCLLLVSLSAFAACTTTRMGSTNEHAGHDMHEGMKQDSHE